MIGLLHVGLAEFTQYCSYRNKIPEDVILRLHLVVKGWIAVLGLFLLSDEESGYLSAVAQLVRLEAFVLTGSIPELSGF